MLSFEFSFVNKNEIYSALTNRLLPILESSATQNFYYDNWPRPQLVNPNVFWTQLTKSTNQSTGYFKDSADTPLQTGVFSSNNLYYAVPGTLIKFIPPSGKYFLPNGKLVNSPTTSTRDYKWVKVASVIGDGAYNGLGTLPDGTGPVILTQNVVSGVQAKEAIPPLETVLSFALQTDIVQLCTSKRNFGLSFAEDTRTWYIINDTDLNLVDPFNLTFQKDVSNSNRDSSWVFAFIWTGLGYRVQYRTTDYIFESEKETGFYFESNAKNYDFEKNTVIKDQISVLGINS